MKISAIPEVRGLRLGMTQNQVIQKYPGCRGEVGANCFYRAENIKEENLRKGLDALSIEFEMDSWTVKEFSIIYDDSIKWSSMREFADTIATSLNLPKDKWVIVPNKKSQPTAFSPMKQICSNYIVTVSMIDETRPSLTVTKSEQLLKFEENQRQQNNKKLFKP